MALDLKLVFNWYNNLKGSIDGGNAEFTKTFKHAKQIQDALNIILNFINVYLSSGRAGILALPTPSTSTYEKRLHINEVNTVKNDLGKRTVINGGNRLPVIQSNPKTIRKINFKSLLESIAEKNGLLFMPWNGGKKHSNGKSIYCFGDKCKIYIDNGVAFLKSSRNSNMRTEDEWDPVSIEELVQNATRSSNNDYKHRGGGSQASTTSNNNIPKNMMDIDDMD